MKKLDLGLRPGSDPRMGIEIICNRLTGTKNES